MLFREGIVAFFAVYSGFICESRWCPTCTTANPARRRPVIRFLWRIPLVRMSLQDFRIPSTDLRSRIYHHERGWSTGIASLPFIAVGLGMLTAVLTNLLLNKSYIAKTRAHGAQLPPESRLVLCCAGGVVLPVGLMVFAFTARPSVHWIVPVGAGALFGFGFVGIFLSMTVRPPSFRLMSGMLITLVHSPICWIRTSCTRLLRSHARLLLDRLRVRRFRCLYGNN